MRQSNVIYKPHDWGLGLARGGNLPLSPGLRAVLFSKQTTVCQEINTILKNTTANNNNNTNQIKKQKTNDCLKKMKDT